MTATATPSETTIRLRRQAAKPKGELEEYSQSFACFGGTVNVRASGPNAPKGIELARTLALDVHRRLSRFEPDSELSRLNSDPRERVRASEIMRTLARATRRAGVESGGLVDSTCLPAVKAAGYREHWDKLNPDRSLKATLDSDWRAGGWEKILVDGDFVIRPVGTQLDSGGLGKGIAADLMAAALADCETWLVDCGGDLRLGGTARIPRSVNIADPYDGRSVLHTYELAAGAVATSGTTGRAWANGHHLIDPRTGQPAETGIVQATAVTETCLEAEIRAKTALLSGRECAAAVLTGGGVYVTDDHSLHLLPLRPGFHSPRGECPGSTG
jgi:thiamine biosynthesis lipoprotein